MYVYMSNFITELQGVTCVSTAVAAPFFLSYPVGFEET